MNNEWYEFKVEDLASSDSNAMATGPFGSAISSKFFLDEGVPVIRGKNLSAAVTNRMSDDGLVFVDQEKANSFKRSTVKAGDLIFTCWGTINQVGLITDDLGYSEYVISNKQMKLTPDPKKADSLFLYYIFSSPEKQAEILSNGIGAAVPGFNLGQLKNHIVYLPTIEKQKEIASFLDSFDQKIRLNTQTNQTLEQIAQAIFKSWFVDFEPVKAKVAVLEAGGTAEQAELAAMSVISAKDEAALKQLQAEQPDAYAELAQTAALFPSAMEGSELGEIPEGWGTSSLDKVAHYQNGLALQKFRPKNENEFLPVVKIAQLKKGFADGEEKASPDIKPECIIDNGDVVFSWSGSLVVDIWCGGEAALNQHLFKVTSENFPKWFYYYFTKHHLAEFQRIAADKAVTMGHIKREHLASAKCAIPANEVINKGSVIIGSLLEKQIEQRLETNSLAETRDTLLPKLLAGDLPITNTGEATA